MKPSHQQQRINLAELKAEITKKLGPEGSKQYFYYLSRFLSLKLSKVEFNKLCYRIIGRENIPLHNQFVRAILRNACNAKVPPPTHGKAAPKQREPNQLVLSNGDILPSSTQKVPTEFRDCKFLGYNNSDVKLEIGDLVRKPVQHHQGLRSESENEEEIMHRHHHANLSKSLQDDAVCVQSKEGSARSLLQAPIGLPSGMVSAGGARKVMPLANNEFCAASSFSIGSLLDSSALRERMEKIALMQGLKGVTMDCASLLNKGLDSYLKGLISSGFELVGTRLGSEPTQSYTNKHQANIKLINGVRPGHYHHKPSNMPLGGIQENQGLYPISLRDFKIAMELNPQQLGEDWPLLLEKICTRAFEE